ncbi:hypothetical protein SKAU_G00032050 [Synaphobranchus kaupii]|uniref:Uncharacterized protein n=1 Tax=Synaphobranchus kaupii TaxID=118154 RepID=A0A9Q1GFW2_SYNKA|nr:hypothetical protein SKAU_G00032050 [Synaphobranchus kaupii]
MSLEEGKRELKEEWRKGEEVLRMTIKETLEKERGGVLPTGSRGNMGLDPAAERLPGGCAAVPVNLELRLAQVGEAKTTSSVAGKAFPQETETWPSSSDWFHRTGLVNTGGGRDAGCHENLPVRAPRPICAVPVGPYLWGEESGQISREPDSGCRPALFGELIPTGGEDLQLAAGMHDNGDQVLSNGNLGDCGRVPELPGEEAQEESSVQLQGH